MHESSQTAGPERDVGAQKISAGAAGTAKYANLSILAYFDPAHKKKVSKLLSLNWSSHSHSFEYLSLLAGFSARVS